MLCSGNEVWTQTRSGWRGSWGWVHEQWSPTTPAPGRSVGKHPRRSGFRDCTRSDSGNGKLWGM